MPERCGETTYAPICLMSSAVLTEPTAIDHSEPHVSCFDQPTVCGWNALWSKPWSMFCAFTGSGIAVMWLKV